MRELAHTTNDEAREIMAEISVGLNRTVALAAPKIFQLNHRLGEQTVVKLLVLLLKSFVDSVRVPDKLGPADIIEVADTLAQTYTHDSIKDILLALKEARMSGTIFYQALDASQIYALITAYFDKKAAWLESQHRDRKAQATSLEYSAVAQLQQLGPQLVQHLQLRIAPDHPNADLLRRKLSLTKQQEQRGLITPAQATQSRADVAAANVCKPRADWQPRPETQQLIDARHRQEDREIMDRYRVRP
ncbi:MAG: hypothetical protein H7Z21_14520 [Hymenobacter sp.]|nr:hypothetical protein [Hymenobacter sp.]